MWNAHRAVVKWGGTRVVRKNGKKTEKRKNGSRSTIASKNYPSPAHAFDLRHNGVYVPVSPGGGWPGLASAAVSQATAWA